MTLNAALKPVMFTAAMMAWTRRTSLDVGEAESVRRMVLDTVYANHMIFEEAQIIGGYNVRGRTITGLFPATWREFVLFLAAKAQIMFTKECTCGMFDAYVEMLVQFVDKKERPGFTAAKEGFDGLVYRA